MANARKLHPFLRRPRTQQARRENSDPEVGELVRPSRRAKNLPTLWHDLPPSGIGKPHRGRKPRYKDHHD